MIGCSVRSAVLGLLLAAIMVTMLNASGTAAASPPGVAWNISLVAQPTNLPLTGHGPHEPAAQYVLVLTNTGSVASSQTITLTDTLPPGVTVGHRIEESGGVFEGSGWECPSGKGASVVICTYSGSVPALGQSPVLTIPVAVTMAGKLTNQVTVSGGGGPNATASRITEAGASAAPFELIDLSSQASDMSGGLDNQASDHPYALTTTLNFSQTEVEGSPNEPVQYPKSVDFNLPAGLVGNPQAASQCTMTEVFAKSCPASSQVGTLFLNFNQGLFEHGGQFPIYNVVPEHGYPAEFVFYALRIEKPGFMYATVRTGSDYGLHLSVPDIPRAASAANVVATFYGDPQRVDGGKNPSIPFFTNPSECSGVPLVTGLEAVSWEEPNRRVAAEAQSLPVGGCSLLQFQPAIVLTPNTTLADEPSGYGVDLEVPQSQTTGLEGLATPDLKNATVTLPQGVSISPGASDGLAGCPADGPEGINLSSAEAGHCPLASQVGSAEAHTPLLGELAHGHVYLALPNCGGEGQGPCGETDAVSGNLFGLYLELEDAGVIIKQHGTVSVNPVTGQITTSFKNAPQLPFDDLKLTLKDGPRAPLANPQTCGNVLTTSDITPWSSPQTPDATPTWLFAVTGCEGSPFAPTFEAGTVNPAAGAYTNFTATFSRSDRQQDLSTIQIQTPPGLLGMLSHVTLCGEAQAAAGTCSSASEIGTARASAGAGSHPFWASGPVYLTGPYNGAPFGLSIPIQAKAGPFNLGTIVTRAMLNVDPTTSALTVTSEPLPQIFRGVPLRVQTVNVTVNKPQFMFNPTNCDAKQVTASIVSAQNAVAHVSSPFAAGGCKNLPFNPGFKVATRAPGSKKKGTSLDVKVSSAPGQANIHSISVSLPKQLPSRLTTIQQACPEATFAANPATCPAGSLIGVARGISPVLSVPIVGPAYLVSHGGAAFPDLKLILQAEGVRVDLTGSINIKGQITSSTFASIPDVPISSFELKLPEGPHSALTPNGNLCAKPLIMPTTIVGQNGRRLVRSTRIAVAGCPKKKPVPKKKSKHGK